MDNLIKQIVIILHIVLCTHIALSEFQVEKEESYRKKKVQRKTTTTTSENKQNIFLTKKERENYLKKVR